MTVKSRQTLREARILHSSGCLDGAASRSYYSLYQAMIPLLVKNFVSPAKLATKLRIPISSDTWPHAMVNQVAETFLRRDGAKIYDKALKLRIRSDYRPDPVQPAEIVEVLDAADTLLSRLGA